MSLPDHRHIEPHQDRPSDAITADWPRVGSIVGTVSLAMPAVVGIHFSHATVQFLADAAGVDVLHIKGPALDPRLVSAAAPDQARGADSGGDPPAPVRPPRPRRPSVDADVLVRPSQVPRLIAAMAQAGWRVQYDFADGSAFEHAATLVHPRLAPVDVHRRFPGIGEEPEPAFDRLWRDRADTVLGGVRCPVPSLDAQRLILLVHAARGPVTGHRDVARAWDWADTATRQRIDALAGDLGARVAVGAATGRLQRHRDAREYALWRALSTGDHRPAVLWAARVRAAPSPAEAMRVGVRLALPNPRRLEASLGRSPTRPEIMRALVSRASWAMRAVSQRRRPSPDAKRARGA